MKRSTSKKQKDGHLKSVDGSQQKISTFFQRGPAQPQSKLFRNVAAKSKAPLSFKQQLSSSRSANGSSSKGVQEQHTDSDKNSLTVLKDFNSSTPQHETPQKSGSVDLSDQGSPEVFAIPDTPESKVSKSWPKPISRSFLCPVSQLSTMPGKRTSPKLQQKKVAKKSLGPVSVEFGKKRLSEDEKAESKAKENSVVMNDITSDCSANFVISCPQTNSGEVGVGSDLSDFNCESDCLSTGTETTKPQENNSELPPTKQSVTPTKNYSDRNAVKRMAVQGLSPDPKRLFGDEALTADSNPKTTISQCKVKAKRQLAALTGFKTMKEMNQSVNHYQLGGSTKPMAKTDPSCTKDDVLADILGEIANQTPQPKSSGKKMSAPHTQKPANPITASNCLKVESMETEPSFDPSEDVVLKDILGELDNKLCQNRNNISKGKPDLSSKKSDAAPNKSRKKTDKSMKPKPLLKGDGLTEPHKHVQETKDAANSGKQSASELQCSTLQTKGTATKTSEHLDVQVKDSVNSELASSFGQLSPFKHSKSARSCSQSPEQDQSSLKFTDKWNRYSVLSVTVDGNSHDKILELSKEGTTEVARTARLQGFWSDTHIEQGDVVHLLLEGRNYNNGNDDSPIIISDHQGQIVVNPDLLLSGTTIVSGVYCLRRSILNEKFKGVDSKNVHMLYGSIIHSLFQEVLKDRLTKTEEIMAAAKSIVKSNKFLHDMYGQCATEAKVMEEIEAYISPLQAWLHKHVPSIDSRNNNRSAEEVSVVQIHDIEETIWSPRIGVKGKIDMTVEVKMHDRGKQKRKVLPLELKTGKASYSVEHKGQVTLYSMMMSDRRQNPEEGLLLYLKHNDMNTIPVKPENTRGLLQLRNEMAYYLSRQVKKTVDGDGNVSHSLGPLPPPINSLRSCAKCPQLVNCAVYQKSVENAQHAPDHAMNSLVPDALSHLSEAHLSYFRHWLLCMELETAAQHTEGLRNIWCMSSAEREARGDCLQQLVMVNSTLGVPETQTFMEGKGCCVQFQRKPGFSGGPLNMSGLTKNDSVVISSEDGRYIALSTGFIKNITETILDVVVDRDSFHENTAFQSLVFRVDRSDVFNTAGYLLTNLSHLLDASPHCQKLRSLIIDGKKPEFQLTMSKSAVEKVKRIFRSLNKPQKTAILKVLMSKDYVLIKGYPGTGKTSTIVALVKILRTLGQTILLTSYTHSAVDNILLKLKKDGVPFLRLGRSSRIHPLIQDHAAETLTLDITSVEELKDFYNSYGIVATSCLGVNHPIFTQRRFDVCIVDEASQVLQPACLGPLFHADRFVLVGDTLQLPPVVQSRDASSLGMGESLFARLDGAGATYDLHLQYRMNSTIMRLSNELVYKGAMACGDDNVSKACIQPHTVALEGDAEWLYRALDSSLPNAVVFLDTCQIHAPEKSDSTGLTNDTEAALILRLCTVFVQAGISASDIGVIAPYRAQVRSLRKRLSEYSSLQEVEVNTVDQYQGRDKSVVFISFVRSSSHEGLDSKQRGALLQDMRRLNVAVTRAKHKLVLVGNSCTLKHYQPVGALLNNLQASHQIFPLPADLQLEDIDTH